MVLRDVGRITQGKQHPLLLDYTSERGVALFNPTLVSLKRFSPGVGQSIREVDPLDREELGYDPIGEHLRMARDQREKFLELEEQNWAGGESAESFTCDGVISIPFVF